ncbi:MAG: CsgG/HfaB family protein [Prevotellaceae bacterium]|jgi:hypothetical protein|nr:CsgG/HfaB family protein [Prevotellaceae bacterium]
MKKIICFILLLFVLLPLSAQEQKTKIAIFDPVISGKIFDEGAGVMIREIVSEVIVNSGKYSIVERSLIDKILKEQKFSNSGVVDENQISAIGKLAGANKVLLSVLSSSGDKGLLSLKIIDVQSATVESQKTKLVNQSEVLDIANSLAFEVLGEEVPASKSTPKKENKTEENKSILNGIGSIFTKTEEKEEKNNSKETIITSVISPQSVGDDEIAISFPGFSTKKNPTAQLFLDGKPIGYGNLNDGFSVKTTNDNPGKHELKIEWSKDIDSKSYTIYTQAKKYFVFEYVKGGFGYVFQLKD